MGTIMCLCPETQVDGKQIKETLYDFNFMLRHDDKKLLKCSGQDEIEDSEIADFIKRYERRSRSSDSADSSSQSEVISAYLKEHPKLDEEFLDSMCTQFSDGRPANYMGTIMCLCPEKRVEGQLIKEALYDFNSMLRHGDRIRKCSGSFFENAEIEGIINRYERRSRPSAATNDQSH